MHRSKRLWLLVGIVGVLAVLWVAFGWEGGGDGKLEQIQVQAGEREMMLADCEGVEMPAGDVPVTWLGSEVRGRVGKVYVQDGYAYLNVGESTVVLDVSNPYEPKEVRFLQGIVPLVIDPREGQHYFQIEEPMSPASMSCQSLSNYVEGSQRSIRFILGTDDVSYQHHWGSLSIIDQSNMENPIQLDRYELRKVIDTKWVWYSGNILPHIEYTYDSSVITEMALNNNYLYLLEVVDPFMVTNAASDGHERLTILDVSNPNDVAAIGHYSLRKDDYLWSRSQIIVDEAYVFVSYQGFPTEGELLSTRIIDVSDPQNPVEVSELYAGKLHSVHRGQAYFVDEERDLVIWDVSDPTMPIEASVLALPQDGAVGDIVFDGDYAYVDLGEAGLHIFDVRDGW